MASPSTKSADAIFFALSKNASFKKKKKKPTAASSSSPVRPAAAAAAAAAAAGQNGGSESDMTLLRKRLGIKVKGREAPKPMLSFRDLADDSEDAQPIARILLDNIEASKFKDPTPIQMQAIPTMLAKRDVLGIAPTGSGKTAAFLIPIILLPRQRPGVKGLVVCPTHELADQILNEYRWLANTIRKRALFMVAKSDNMAQIIQACKGQIDVDLLVCTPQILVGLIESKKVESLACVSVLVLDEADRLLDLGFVEQADTVLDACSSPDTVRAMFSATMPPRIETLVDAVLRDGVKVFVGQANAGAEDIDQRLVFTGNEEGKLTALSRLLKEGDLAPPCLVFCQTQERAADLCLEMRGMDSVLQVEAIHGGVSPRLRDEICERFRQGKVWFLIATEVLGRGLDFKGVNTVVNFDLPLSPVAYIHRIGRCGRAGRRGKAITLFTEEEFPRLRPIANVVRISGCDVPEWMLGLKAPSCSEKRRMAVTAPVRPKILGRYRVVDKTALTKPKRFRRGDRAGEEEQGEEDDDEEIDDDEA